MINSCVKETQMAKIVTDTVVVQISRIAKDNQTLDSSVSTELEQTLEQVVQELVGDGAVVEIQMITSEDQK